jgi:hypothetical protein
VADHGVKRVTGLVNIPSAGIGIVKRSGYKILGISGAAGDPPTIIKWS